MFMHIMYHIYSTCGSKKKFRFRGKGVRGGGLGGLSESDILVCRGEGGKLCKLMKSESKQPTPPASNKHMYFALSLKMQFVMNIAEKCIHHKQGGIFGSSQPMQFNQQDTRSTNKTPPPTSPIGG